MSELHEPPLVLSVEAKRWMGDEWKTIGEGAATIEIHSTDQGETNGGQLIRLLRATVNERLKILIPMLLVTYEHLDWEAPNPPTEADLGRLVARAERVTEALRVLKQLAPEVIQDDDEDGDRDQEPGPEPSPEAAQS
jgi:hypothetical protein